MPIVRLPIFYLFLVANTVTWASADATQVPAGQRHIESLWSLRWKGVARQQFDYSCGTGSITNLIAFLGQPAPDEAALIKAYTEKFPTVIEQAVKEGFSLLDLKRMLGTLGYNSIGVRYEPGTLPDELQPMIVYLVVRGYRHFAVFAGIKENQVVLLDSARGKISISIDRFLLEWDGSALLLDPLPAGVTLPDERVKLPPAAETVQSTILKN